MIQEFADRFLAAKGQMLADLKAKRPDGYADLLKRTVTVISSEDEYRDPDASRIHCIDDGDYQGTLLFIIAAKGYQPSDYWYVKVGYGSCSGCDTFQAIGSYSSDPVTDEEAKEYWDLCLHMVQRLKKMDDEN